MSEAKETTALAIRTLDEVQGLARTIADSVLIPQALRKRPGDVLVTVLAGRELGLGPMASIRGIHVIEGKPVMSADLLVGLCKSHPACESWTMVETTPKRCTYETKRRSDARPTRMSWTIEQAQAAGLTGKDNWRKYPDAMLRARCAAALARAVYPDVVGGCYEDGEAQDFQPPPSPMRGSTLDESRNPVVEGEVVQVVQEHAAALDRVPGEDDGPPPSASGSLPLEQLVLAAVDLAALQALTAQAAALPDGPEKERVRAAYRARRTTLGANGNGSRP